MPHGIYCANVRVITVHSSQAAIGLSYVDISVLEQSVEKRQELKETNAHECAFNVRSYDVDTYIIWRVPSFDMFERIRYFPSILGWVFAYRILLVVYFIWQSCACLWA